MRKARLVEVPVSAAPAETKERILDVAEALFMEHGYEEHRRPGLRAGDTWRKRLRLIQIRFERERLSEDARPIVKINRIHNWQRCRPTNIFPPIAHGSERDR
jgi:hypothetical protein